MTRPHLVPVNTVNIDVMVAAQGTGETNGGSKRGRGRWWLMQHGLRATTWEDRSMLITRAEQGKRKDKEALGPRSSLTCEVGQQHDQDRSPGHGLRPAAICFPQPLLLGPLPAGKHSPPCFEKRVIAPWFLLTTLLSFLGLWSVTDQHGVTAAFVALPWSCGSVLGGSTC